MTKTLQTTVFLSKFQHILEHNFSASESETVEELRSFKEHQHCCVKEPDHFYCLKMMHSSAKSELTLTVSFSS